MLGLEAAMSLVDQTKTEQDTQRPTTDTAEGSERTNPCVLQDQQVAPSRASPHTGRPFPGRTPENQEPGSPPYPCPWGLGAPYNRQGTTDSEGSLTGREEGDSNQNKMLLEETDTSDTSGLADPMTTEDPHAPEDPQGPGQPPPKEL